MLSWKLSVKISLGKEFTSKKQYQTKHTHPHTQIYLTHTHPTPTPSHPLTHPNRYTPHAPSHTPTQNDTYETRLNMD